MPSKQEKREVVNSTKGFSSSLFVHSLLILIGISPLATFKAPIWEEEQPGMEVALGFPDEGQGNDEPTPGNNEPGGLPPADHSTAQASTSPPPATTAPSNTAPATEPMVTNDNSESVDVEAANEAKRRKAEQEQIEAEQRRRDELIAEANRKAEAERKAREAQYNASKGKYGGLLKGSGSGRGNTGKAGNQGDPNGDPNAKNLEGIHTGKGRIGGGLGNRGVVSEPKITDNSQKEGRVIIKVCVNGDGNVISAEFTQKGSTTQDPTLVNIAKRNARKFKFTPSEASQQCGTITYDFKLQ
ncbi:MAG: hypothetical protein J5I59_09710 [Saprospiraceae bacterium]|nr:hypothetical protein [Saprospiraceae bacterium]